MTTVATAAAAAAVAPVIEECLVCCEPYNKRNHTPVECEYADCKYKVCIECVRTYLMNSTNEAHCMECNKAWSQDFKVKALKASWINGAYRQHRKKLLVDIEISKLPETMEAAARYKVLKSEQALQQELKKEISVIEEKCNADYIKNHEELKAWFNGVYTPQSINPSLSNDDKIKLNKQHEQKLMDLYNGRKKWSNEINPIKSQLDLCKRRIHALTHPNAGDMDGASAAEEKKEKRVFLMPCPSNECNGMLSTQYKCGICELFACPKCHEIIGKDISIEHTCDPNNVASAEAIKKETKQCPGCPNRIFRIEGCSQMWCTGCHTAFDWNSGRVVKSDRLHNPHWIEYQRNKNHGQAPRAPGDVPCGGLITRHELDGIIRRKIEEKISRLLKKMRLSYSVQDIKQYIELYNMKLCILRIYQTIDQITRNSIRVIREELQRDQNFELHRCKYIIKEITKEQLSTHIHKMLSKREKMTQLLHVYELLSAVGIDVFNDIYNNQLDDDAYIQHISSKIIELDALRNHCNSLFAQTSYNYNLSAQLITENWFMVTMKYKKREMDYYKNLKPKNNINDMFTNVDLLGGNSCLSNSDVIELIVKERNNTIDNVVRQVEKYTELITREKPEIESGINELPILKKSLQEKLVSGDDDIEEINDKIRMVEKKLKEFEELKLLLEKKERFCKNLMSTLDTIQDEVWEGGKYMKKP